MFSDTSTLHNCVVYHAIAQYLLAVEQNETVDSPAPSSVQHLTDLGYRTHTLHPGPAIDRCFKGYCDSSKNSGCKNNYLYPVLRNSSVKISSRCGEGKLQNIRCFFDICRHINSPANPDIGGQGVRVFQCRSFISTNMLPRRLPCSQGIRPQAKLNAT